MKKKIAMVAHDEKKQEMLEWATFNKKNLEDHYIFATGTTGRLLEETLGIEIYKLRSGPLGGDQQIGAMIAEGEIDLVIFMWDPMHALPHDSDIKALLRICMVYNVPVACNRSSADYLISSPLLQQDYQPKVPDYLEHIQRTIK
ncbi:MAG: methylglyoxal synthase [Cytophagaceae bacterium]|jgi:methylglyoxal synthase|nr:methylglyoxal synthase [Cytophagaceae bacterium]